MRGKRGFAHLRAIAGMIAVTGAALPVSAVAQTTTDVTDLIKKLQSEIGTMEKQHQAEMRNLQKQHQAQIQNLQKQLDELKAAQAGPRAVPPPASAPPAALAAATAPAPGPPRTPGAPQPPSGAAQPPAAAGQGGPQIIVGVPPPGLPLPSAGVHVLEAGSARFGIESADGRNAIFLTGRLHFDVADYLDYKPGSRFAAVQDLNSGVNARRARLGVVGRFMSDWDYTFIYDLGGSGDGFPPDPGALTRGLENALVTYSGLKNHGVPLVFDLGYMDVPFGQAESTSSNDIPLVERAAISNVATNIFANDFRSAFGARSFSDRYWVGAYVTGPTSGTNHTTGGAARCRGARRLQHIVQPGRLVPRRSRCRRAVETTGTRRDPIDHLGRPARTAGRPDPDPEHRSLPRNGGQSAHERAGVRRRRDRLVAQLSGGWRVLPDQCQPARARDE